MTDSDDRPSNQSGNRTFSDMAFNRRGFLRAGAVLAAAGGAAIGTAGGFAFVRETLAGGGDPSTLTFQPLPQGYDENHHVAEGYDADVLIRWGDPVVAGAPPFDPRNQSATAQAEQFGYNCDFIGFAPLPRESGAAGRGLLCVNHEYTIAGLMFPGPEGKDPATQPREQMDIEMAAIGHSVVEIVRGDDGKWSVVEGSRLNRRIHLGTPMRVGGPAAGDERLKTSADPTGKRVVGTLGNCAGSVTPWGTVLIAEENFHGYFGGDPSLTPEARNHARYGLGRTWYGWHRFYERFDVEREPNEPNRFGWMVEFDPYDPESVPVKRTGLGRFKHEGAHVVVAPDGRLVAYSGDDEAFEYIYRFVSKGRFDPSAGTANGDLLDDGTLSVARFNPDGTLDWIALVQGRGPLTPENGFSSQADVLIEARRAADLVGATPMDRPEEIEPNPVTGIVYAMLTGNSRSPGGSANPANPRAGNRHGHIIEMIPPGRNAARRRHAADHFTWDFFLLAGDPGVAEDGAAYHPDQEPGQWMTSPDNCAFDTKGRIWIATDGAPHAGFADGLWAADTQGPGRAYVKRFFTVPRGAEHSGPCFNPDDTAYFGSVQHPGDEHGSTFEAPSTRWPDFRGDMPPRPSVVVVTKNGGGAIG